MNGLACSSKLYNFNGKSLAICMKNLSGRNVLIINNNYSSFSPFTQAK